jgi:hypothetical protein
MKAADPEAVGDSVRGHPERKELLERGDSVLASSKLSNENIDWASFLGHYYR